MTSDYHPQNPNFHSYQNELHHLVFHEADLLKVRSVTLRPDDDIQALREKLAKVLLDDMFQFVALLDNKGTLLEVNRAALEGGGIHIEDIQGKPFWEAHWWTISSSTQKTLQDHIKRAAQGEFCRYDVDVYGGAGGSESITIDFSLIPVTDHNNKVVFLLAEGRDISEKKAAEAQIAQKNEELQKLISKIKELDEVKSQFFANVSHELRTPLALILGPAEKILGEGQYLQEAHRRGLNVIRRNASTLLKHVNDLLELSKLDAGKMSVNCQSIDLARLVRLIAGHFEALAAEKNIRFEVSAPENLYTSIDSEKIERVILNLLSNAFKFTPAGGTIQVKLNHNADKLFLSISDTGPGVKEDQKELIFERFRQGEGGSTRQFGGTGIGLSITKDFVELHGGSITVLDNPGGGARFEVSLPSVPVTEEETSQIRVLDKGQADDNFLKGTIEELRTISNPSPGRAESKTPGKPLVLVAEDNPELRDYIESSLSSEFNVTSASNGEEALARIQDEKPDLIMTDIMMPKMSGDQFIAKMRMQPEYDDVPVIVLSAKADDSLRLKLLETGAQDYVMKPFSTQELLTRARNLASAKIAKQVIRKLNTELEKKVDERTLELKESEAKFRTITNVLPQMVWSSNPDGIVDYYNQRWYEFTGARKDDQEWLKYVHPDERDEVTKAWSKSFQTGKDYELELRLRHHSGDYRSVLVRALPVRNEKGEITRWMGTYTDVQTYRETSDALEKAVKFRDEFLSIASHELKTPLTSLYLSTQLYSKRLLRDDENILSAEKMKAFLTGIDMQISRLARLVEDMLDISRIQTGRLTLKTETINLRNRLIEVLEKLKHDIEQADVKIAVSSTAEIIGEWDALRIEQVLTNLITNAIKYGRSSPINITIGQENDNAHIVIQDQGIGISKEAQHKIFDKFYRSIAPNEVSGLGLGLYISKEIIEAHHGRIWVESAGEGAGSAFHIQLPKFLKH